jgi:superfamily II DNA/RNA helicase
MNYKNVSEFQQKILNEIINIDNNDKENLIIKSETGSGKTLIYSLIVINHLLKKLENN